MEVLGQEQVLGRYFQLDLAEVRNEFEFHLEESLR